MLVERTRQARWTRTPCFNNLWRRKSRWVLSTSSCGRVEQLFLNIWQLLSTSPWGLHYPQIASRHPDNVLNGDPYNISAAGFWNSSLQEEEFEGLKNLWSELGSIHHIPRTFSIPCWSYLVHAPATISLDPERGNPACNQLLPRKRYGWEVDEWLQGCGTDHKLYVYRSPWGPLALTWSEFGKVWERFVPSLLFGRITMV